MDDQLHNLQARKKKVDNVQFDLVNESRNFNRKRVEREWEITVIGAGDGVEGLEG